SAGSCTCTLKKPSSHGNLTHQTTGQPPINPGSSPPPTIPAPQRCSIPTSAGKTATASNTAGPAEVTNPPTTTARKPRLQDWFPGCFNTQNQESIHIFWALPRYQT